MYQYIDHPNRSSRGNNIEHLIASWYRKVQLHELYTSGGASIIKHHPCVGTNILIHHIMVPWSPWGQLGPMEPMGLTCPSGPSRRQTASGGRRQAAAVGGRTA